MCVFLAVLVILIVHVFCLLTHFNLETPKRVIDKQCRTRSDAPEGGDWSGSTLVLFALTTVISIKHGNNKN